MPPHQNPQSSHEPDGLSLRPPRGAVSGIRKRYVHLALVGLVAVVAAALVIGLGIDFHPSHNGAKREIDLPPRDSRPAELAALPDKYDQVPPPQPAPQTGSATTPNATTTDGQPTNGPQAALQQQNVELRRNLAAMMTAINQINTKNQKLLDKVNRYQDQTQKAQAKAWQSPVLFKIDDKGQGRVNPNAAGAVATAPSDGRVPFATTPETSAGAFGASRVAETSATSGGGGGGIDQERKRAFLRQSSAPDAELDAPYLYPRSPYEVQAGTVIPAALLTGINTDLPGEVIAMVTSPVYDSATGQHTLIPQGAKLLGNYDSEIGNGQNRALLVWHRLLMPNGRSITLGPMPGTDAAGYAGLADRVDYHAGKLAAGAVLSSVLAYAGNLARSTSGGAPGSGGSVSARDVIGDTVAQQAGRIGSKIINRQLDVQPTITVRPGWPVRVLVNKDIELSPYQP